MGCRRRVRRVTLVVAIVLTMALVGPAWTAAGSEVPPTDEASGNAAFTTELNPTLPTDGTSTPTPATTDPPTATATATAASTETTSGEILGTTVPDPERLETTVESTVNDSTEATIDGTVNETDDETIDETSDETIDATDPLENPLLSASLVEVDDEDSTDVIVADLSGTETTHASTPRPSTVDPTSESENESKVADEPDSESAPETTASVSKGSASGPGGPLALPDAEDAAPVAVVGVGSVAAAALARQFGLTASLSWPGLGATFEAGVERALRFTSIFRYSRHDDSDPLEHDVRSAVHEAIVDQPGLHLSGLAEATDVPISTVRHHVRVLEREQLLAGVKLRGKRRFFPVDADGHELAAALTDEATAAVLAAVARHEPASVTTLALDLDRDASTVSHHLTRLTEDGLVERERDGRKVLTRLSSQARTALGDDDESTPDSALPPAD